MSDNEDKRYCIVDHAAKRGERQARNPNRLKLTKERYGRWIVAASGQRKASDKAEDG